MHHRPVCKIGCRNPTNAAPTRILCTILREKKPAACHECATLDFSRTLFTDAGLTYVLIMTHLRPTLLAQTHYVGQRFHLTPPVCNLARRTPHLRTSVLTHHMSHKRSTVGLGTAVCHKRVAHAVQMCFLRLPCSCACRWRPRGHL